MAEKKFRSVPDLLLGRVAMTPDRPAYRYPSGDRWVTLSWSQTLDRVRDVACGLLALGVNKGDCCAIVSSTRIEWILADFAILSAGGVTTTIYPSNTVDETAYIITDSASRIVFAEDDEQVKKLTGLRPQLGDIRKVIVFDGVSAQGDWILPLSRLEEMGRAYHLEHPQAFETAARAVDSEDLATLLYTSGTTGRPKGVKLVHDCWVYEAEAIEALDLLNLDDHQYLWLPLSHSLGKVLQMMQLKIGFATSVDGRIPKLVDNLSVVRPTFMAAAPRIFEKVYSKIVGQVHDEGGVKLAVFNWAFAVGARVSKLRQRNKSPGPLLALQYSVAHRLVFAKLHQRFGGNLRFFISGSAPLARDIAEFFHSAGILILEGYGLTESSAASFVDLPRVYKMGTVGPPVPGTQVRIDPVDGEVLLKGRGIMRGYHKHPELTAEVLTEDGWLRTGDIGQLDADNHLTITDRKKDLIKTAGGKYIAPQNLEGRLKSLQPMISQVVVHGDRRPFCTALVTLDPESLLAWAKQHAMDGAPREQLVASPAVRALMQEAVDKLNSSLARFETIKKFEVLPNDFTVEAGELTPTQKIKRQAVEKKFKAILDSFYEVDDDLT